MLESLKNKKILVVVAHPDDEILGVGGTIFQLVKYYDCNVRVVILGEGLTSRADQRDTKNWEEQLSIHKNNILNAQAILGYQSVGVYDFPDNRFDSIPLLDLVKTVEREKEQFRPNVIFTHHGGDVNIDHQRTFEAVITATRPIETEVVSSIITFETMSGTEWRASSDPRVFLPNLFIELNEKSVERKIEAMNCYEFECRNFPHPRSGESIKIRAQMWGIANGCHFAEAFQIIRNIEKFKRDEFI